MENREPKIHVVYYTPGKNMQGLNKLMANLQKIWGNHVIALPKDIMRLAKEEMSLRDLINMRNMFNSYIARIQNEGNRPTSDNTNTETN